MFLVILMYMLFASTFTIGKTVLAYLQPIFFIGFRMSIGGMLLLGYLYFFKKGKIRLKKQHFWLFLQITIFHIFAAYIAEFWALQYLTSFKTALIYNLSPFVAAIFAFLFFSERMTLKKWVGLIIGFCGFFLVLANGKSPEEVKMNAFGFLSWPEMVMLLAVFSSVYGWAIFKKLGKLGYSPVMINAFGMLTGGILALFASFLCEGPHFLKISPSPLIFEILVVLGYSLLLILIANVVCYNLYGYLLRTYSITLLSFAGFFTPLFAALFGAIFLKEIPSVYFFVALAIIAFGLYIFYQEELRQGYIKK